MWAGVAQLKGNRRCGLSSAIWLIQDLPQEFGMLLSMCGIIIDRMNSRAYAKRVQFGGVNILISKDNANVYSDTWKTTTRTHAHTHTRRKGLNLVKSNRRTCRTIVLV